jgi:single-stranded DNA-binding protein
MRHYQEFTATGDIIQPPQLKSVNGKSVATAQLGIIEERTNQGQKTQQMVKHQIECWGKQASFLASIPVGNTVMVKGKVQHYKYKTQNGGEAWATKISVFGLGNCGPSEYANQQQQQQTQQPGGYQQQTQYPPQNNNYPPATQQPGYGAAPTYPPQNQPVGYPPPHQGQQPPAQTQTQAPQNFAPGADDGPPCPF